jgi:hypothetical protein
MILSKELFKQIKYTYKLCLSTTPVNYLQVLSEHLRNVPVRPRSLTMNVYHVPGQQSVSGSMGNASTAELVVTQSVQKIDLV